MAREAVGMQAPLSEVLGSVVGSVPQAILVAMGAVLVAGTMLFMGYLALGAVLAPLGVQIPTSGKGHHGADPNDRRA